MLLLHRVEVPYLEDVAVGEEQQVGTASVLLLPLLHGVQVRAPDQPVYEG